MRFLLTALAALLLVACGKSDDKPVTTTQNAIVVPKGGEACHQGVIDDYNRYVGVCSKMRNRDEAKVCKAEAEAFVAKYPGLNCKASSEKTGRTMMLTEERVQTVIKKLTDLGV